MRFTFFRSLTVAAGVAMQASAVVVDVNELMSEFQYDLAQLLSGEDVAVEEAPQVMAEANAQELPEPAALT